MHRLNLTIDEPLYEKARTISFLQKVSISELVRQSLTEFLAKNSAAQTAQIILETDDEDEIKAIIADNAFSTQSEFAQKFGL